MADPGSMSPQEAAQAIQATARYEEGLTARTFGLSLMVWACVAYAVYFVSYVVAAGGSEVDFWSGLPFLLLPLVAGMAVTNLLWRTRALSAAIGFRPARVWSQGAALLVAGFIAMVWIDDAFLPDSDSSVSLTLVATLVVIYLAVRLWIAPWQRRPWTLAGAVGLLLADVALLSWAPESLPEPNGWAHLWSATATAAALFVPGYLYVRQG